MTPPVSPPSVAQAWQLHQAGKWRKAEAAYRAIIANQPANLDAKLRLAFLYRQTNRPAQAVTILQPLAAQNPNHPGIAGEYAMALLGNGNFAKAQSIFESLIKTQPTFAPAHLGLGQSLLGQQKTRLAVQALKRANDLTPNNPDILHELGWAHLQNGQPNEAVQYLEKSFKIKPNSPRTRKNLGHVLHVVGRLEEARQHLETAIKQIPADPSIAIYLSEVYQSLGKLDDAQQILSERINTGNAHPGILLAAARIARRKKDLPQALQCLEQVNENESQMPPRLFATSCFEYAAVLEDLGEYDRAFENYVKANNALNYKYNPTATTAQMDALINAYTTAAIANMSRASVKESDLPVFILGMPRSGTTLIEQIIASHSQAFGGGELPHLGQSCSALMSGQNPARENDWNPASVITAKAPELNRAAENYLSRIRALDHDAKRITDKMPPNFFYIGFIAQALPEAHIIHCKRDPIDTCVSIFATPLSPAHPYSTDIAALAHYYREYGRLMAHWRTITADLGINFTEIQYESMIENPETQTRQLIDFCALDWEDACLKFHESKRAVSTASIHQVRQPIYKSSVHRYQRFEDHLAPLIEALGDDLP